MEKSQKRRGFMKSLYRAARPSATARSDSKAKAKQSNSPVTTSPSSGSFAVPSELRSANFLTRSAPPPPTQKQYPSSAKKSAEGGYRDVNAEVRGAYSYGGDENVDAKAATYISCVRERFKLERVDWDQKVC